MSIQDNDMSSLYNRKFVIQGGHIVIQEGQNNDFPAKTWQKHGLLKLTETQPSTYQRHISHEIGSFQI